MAKKKYKDKYDKLANAPIKQLISSLAIPTILSMLVSALYNTADSFCRQNQYAKCRFNRYCIFDYDFASGNRLFLGNGSGIMISTLLGEKKKKRRKFMQM